MSFNAGDLVKILPGDFSEDEEHIIFFTDDPDQSDLLIFGYYPSIGSLFATVISSCNFKSPLGIEDSPNKCKLLVSFSDDRHVIWYVSVTWLRLIT
jgi:hypothetical protein